MLSHALQIAVFFAHPNLHDFAMAALHSTESWVAIDVFREALEDGICRVKNFHCGRTLIGSRMENVSLLAASNWVIYGLDFTRLHQFVK